MKTQAQILREYKKDVNDINEKHRKALERAANRYSRQSIALLKAQSPATVGKPKRSKAGGTRS
jgi:hypothetical protein